MVMLSSTLRGRVLKFHSPALQPNTLIIASLQGQEAISQPYFYDLDLVSTRADIDFRALIQQPATVGIKHGISIRGAVSRGIQSLKVHGILSSLEQGPKTGDWVVYRAQLVPRLWKLSLTLHNRIFMDKTIPELVEAVLQENGFTREDYEFRTTGRRYKRREYVVQYQETDLAFLSRWLEHEGISYRFKQGDDRESVVFVDAPGGFEAVLGDDSLAYRPLGARGEGAGGQADWFQPPVVSTFTSRYQLTPHQVILKDYNWRTPSVDLQVSSPVSDPGTGTIYDYGDHYKDAEEGRDLARLRVEEWNCRRQVFRGTSDAKSFRAGETFRLSDHYRADFNAPYLITSVRHSATQAMALGGASNTLASYENEFSCIPANVPFRPERLTVRPRISGTINAKIDAGGDGKYAEIDEHGRYKVKLPMDLSAAGGGQASRYVRMAQPYAGADHGMHFPLHKGTEVILTHVNGDPDRPVISGAVPNAETASLVKGENQTQCMIKSAGNNVIRLDDIEGAELIFIHAQRNFESRVRNDVREWVGEDRHLHVQRDTFEHHHRNRNETVSGDHQEEIQGDRHVSVRGQQAVDVSGKSSLVVGGECVEVIRGDRSETVHGAGHLKARSFVLESDTGITLKCGANSIVLDAAGITLNGAMVILDGGLTKINSGAGSPPLSATAGRVATPNLPEPALEPGQSQPSGRRVISSGQHAAAQSQTATAGEESSPHWIGIRLVDDDGRPVPHEQYQIRLPNDVVIAGRLDGEGYARVDGIDPGQCEVEFPRLNQRMWRPV